MAIPSRVQVPREVAKHIVTEKQKIERICRIWINIVEPSGAGQPDQYDRYAE